MDMLFDRIGELPIVGRWDLMAQAAMRDDLQKLETDISAAALEAAPGESDARKVVDAWLRKIDGAEAELKTLKEINEGSPDLAKTSVALRTLRAMLA